MKNFDSLRRDFLRTGSLGVAGAALPAVAFGAKEKKVAAQPTVFDVHQYGAVGDGKTVDTPAINRGIQAVAAAGGGTLYFPAGTYVCFTHLASHVDLYLARGCTILAADSPKPGDTTGYNGGTYDAAEPNDPWTPYQDYGHNHWHNSLLLGGEHQRLLHSMARALSTARACRMDRAVHARQLYGVQRRAGGRGQQVHRAEELPQRDCCATFPS